MLYILYVQYIIKLKPLKAFKNNTYYVIDLKVIMDFVPNHTSDKHIWFQKSAKNETDYADYYIWKDAINQEEVIKNNATPIVPNNWVMLKI